MCIPFKTGTMSLLPHSVGQASHSKGGEIDSASGRRSCKVALQRAATFAINLPHAVPDGSAL